MNDARPSLPASPKSEPPLSEDLEEPKKPPGYRIRIFLLGLYLAALPVALFFLMVRFWPAAPTGAAGVPAQADTAQVAPADTTIRPAAVLTVALRRSGAPPARRQAATPEPPARPSPWDNPEIRLILLVLCAGAFGSFLHAANSFTHHVGNKTFAASWTWWYVMRPFVGAVLALIVYFAVRGGLLAISIGGPGDDESLFERLNVFGVVGLSGLVGMFSRQASDKLGEVFDTIFRTRQTPPPYPKPVVSRVEPDRVAAGGSDQVLTVHGKHFVEGKSVVRINGIARKTEFVAPDQLLVHLGAGDLTRPSRLNLTVETSQPGGGMSEPIVVEVTPAEPPAGDVAEG
ncbi:IPT/TIG domain-containing protein [Rhodocaloribacter litoris]|uniref:IPT/TIG domain-containing protein n=1 Tax=Rhodocaloribacter litoris TaxID=2558931 RepID=UPI00141EC018|nr:IPT/TIG domain-containing protein [Rhodocaloribacter litoris]QXD14917.1 IPT/TIG domain-containing protein [Rhodocaloribacter litoris]GIV58986.1 MAG: hypothetical protein KatS3mg043_0075 [Rhodothermaceae bacterium]